MTTTVVVVDDHAGFRRQAGLLLRDAGYDVVGEASGASEAVGLVGRLRPDLVLLDVQLPDGDGFAVAEALGAGALDDGSRPPTIVLISGRDQADYGTRIVRSGAVAFIAKADLTAEALASALGGSVP